MQPLITQTTLFFVVSQVFFCDSKVPNGIHFQITFQTIQDILDGPDEAVMKAIQEGINLANESSVSNAQKVQKWKILNKDFSIFGGELGPTLKMKRHFVLKQYADLVNGFYEQ